MHWWLWILRGIYGMGRSTWVEQMTVAGGVDAVSCTQASFNSPASESVHRTHKPNCRWLIEPVSTVVCHWLRELAPT